MTNKAMRAMGTYILSVLENHVLPIVILNVVKDLIIEL